MGGTARGESGDDDGEGEEWLKYLEITYGRLPSQKLFHASEARFKGFSGPVGSGKSQALCHEAIKLAYQNPGRVGLIGAPTYPMLRDATVATLIELLESNEIPHEVNRSENHVVLTETRSKILFRAVEEFERLRGSNLAWFGLDELTYAPEDAWLRLEGRLRDPKATRLCGFGVWTPKGFDWVYERFIANPITGYETIQAKPFENRFLLDKIPDYYERLKHSYDGRFYQQEALGEYLSMTAGRAYYEFERAGNVEDVNVHLNLPLLWALDFNVDPMCSIIAQVDKRAGVIRVLDEICLSRATTKDACDEFMSRYPSHPGGLFVYADATGQRMQTTGASDVKIVNDQLRVSSYPNKRATVMSSNPPVRERVMLVNAKLKSAAGDHALRIDPKCKELIKDLEQVVYKAGSTVIDKQIDSQRTHLSDALGYLLWQEFHEKAGERNQPLLG